MSNKTLCKKESRKESKGAPRSGFDAYNISRVRYLELRGGCASGRLSPETLRKACRGFEFLMEWIVMSVTKKRSYDCLEYDRQLGRIPCGRTDFYGFRRKFYNNLDTMLKEDIYGKITHQ